MLKVLHDWKLLKSCPLLSIPAFTPPLKWDRTLVFLADWVRWRHGNTGKHSKRALGRAAAALPV